MEIVGQPVSLADINDHRWQKLFVKYHALLLRIQIVWENSPSCEESKIPALLKSVPVVFRRISRVF